MSDVDAAVAACSRGKHSACRPRNDGRGCDNHTMRGTSSLRARGGPIAGLAAMALTACAPIAAPAVDPALMGMGCEQSETFLFSGETSLAALGLGDEFGMGPDAQRIGTVLVTAEPVNMMGPGPLPAGVEAEFDRMVCVQWPDGSGMAGPVPDGWEPPSAVNLDAAADAGPPYVLIGLIAAVAVIAGVSYLAFRGERAG